MRDDLAERDQGLGEPEQLSLRRRVPRVALIVAAGLVALVAVGASGLGSAGPEGAGPVVLVSGRDDHGELATPEVDLLAAPESDAVVAAVPDDTLARVIDTRGEWLQLRTLEGRRATGWVNDYYLRGTLRLVGEPPSCAVEVGGRARGAGQQVTVVDVRGGRALVRLPAGAQGWVDRAYVRELPPQGGDGCI